MNKTILTLTAMVAAFSSGCTESSSMPLGNDSFLITTKGNAFVHEGDVQKEIIMEAAKVCRANGYVSFTIIGMNDISETAYIGSYGSDTTGSMNFTGNQAGFSSHTNYSSPTPIRKPGLRVQIKCYRFSVAGAVDANSYIAANTPKKN